MKKRALKGLKNLDSASRKRILETLEILEENPLPQSLDIRKLRRYGDTYRIRVGKVRIVYSVNWEKEEITVHFIGPREKAYRGI